MFDIAISALSRTVVLYILCNNTILVFILICLIVQTIFHEILWCLWDYFICW